MRSKTSCFNKSLYLSDIKSQIPTLLLLLLGYFAFLFVPGLMEISRSERLDFEGLYSGVDTKAHVLTDVTDWLSNPVLIGSLAILIAVILFRYQYSRRASYMLHSMPVSRMGHFISHALAGLTVLMILVLVSFVSLFFVAGTETWLQCYLLLRLLETFVEVLFFYALALFTVVVCGNAILAIATFGVLNALWLFINMLAAFMHSLLIYHPIASSYRQGFRFMIFENMDMLFPALYFFNHHSRLYLETDSREIVNTGSFLHILWMLIPAAALYVLAALLYKNKSLEKTGEMVTFGWCRVVFRVLFTVCGGGVVLGGVFIMMSNFLVFDYYGNGSLIPFAIAFLIIGSILGFLVSEMLLQKTVHIFKGKKIPFLQGVIPLALMLLYVVLLRTGVIGPSLTPDPDETAQIVITGNDISGYYVFDGEKDAEALKKITETHKILVQDPKLLEEAKKESTGKAADWKYMLFRFIDDDGNYYSLGYAYEDRDDQKRLLDSFILYDKDGSHRVVN